jgi:nitrate/nitrite transporter NarK
MPLLFAGVACLVGGLLSDALVKWTGQRRLGRAILPMFGYLTAAAAMLGVTVTKTPEQATVLLCVAAFTYDLGQGANWASIVDIGGKFAGIAAGFINMVGNMSNAFQPPLGRWIFAEYGWPTLFGVYAAAFCGAALMWLFIDPTKRFYKDEPEVRGFEVGPAKG